MVVVLLQVLARQVGFMTILKVVIMYLRQPVQARMDGVGVKSVKACFMVKEAHAVVALCMIFLKVGIITYQLIK